MATLGPLSPGTIATANFSGGADAAWTDAANVGASNDTYASATLSTSQFSEVIKATNFDDISLPAATIDGIECRYEERGSHASSLLSYIHLIIGGSVIPSNTPEDTTAGYAGTSDAYRIAGGATDQWHRPGVTVAELNDNGFGIALAYANLAGSSRTIYVDHIQLYIHYTPVPTGDADDTSTVAEGAAFAATLGTQAATATAEDALTVQAVVSGADSASVIEEQGFAFTSSQPDTATAVESVELDISMSRTYILTEHLPYGASDSV